MGEQKVADRVEAPMLVRGPEAGQFVRANASFCERTGLTAADLAEHPFLGWIDAADRDRVQVALDAEESCSIRAGHRTRHGKVLALDIEVRPTPEGMIILGRCEPDDGAHAYGEAFDEGTVSGTLETIARIVEDQNPGHKCSILLVDQNRFVRGAGPSLPEEYNAAIDGQAIGPTVGSCGTAIYWNVPVIVEDIQADPLWQSLAELAKEAGVAACWSHPFTSSSGQVLGALALYATEPMAPTAEQLAVLKAAARMTGLAVERGRAEEALREQRGREARLEEQLRQAAKMEALGVLAGGIAHDFNNLLATIRGNADLALLRLPEDAAERTMMERIVVTSQRAGEFCSQMLAYAGRGTMKKGRIDLGQVLSEVSSLAHAALSKKATLEYSLHEEPIYVEADENQLLQVVLNIVTNAAEAIGDEEGRIDVSTAIAHCDAAALARLAPDAELAPGDYARLTVRDTGCGIDEETQKRIFDPFFTTKFTGRGLGLASVMGIIRRHGGVIRMESAVGEGTTFEVLLPVVPAPETAPSEPSSNAADEAVAQRVLVVDDEDELREVLGLLLETGGFSVTDAADGEEALEKFRADPTAFDCVLLDLSLPKRGGEEVFREMRALRHDLPVVLISGFSEQEILDRFEGAKIDGALRKPVAASQLIETVRNAIPR